MLTSRIGLPQVLVSDKGAPQPKREVVGDGETFGARVSTSHLSRVVVLFGVLGSDHVQGTSVVGELGFPDQSDPTEIPFAIIIIFGVSTRNIKGSTERSPSDQRICRNKGGQSQNIRTDGKRFHVGKIQCRWICTAIKIKATLLQMSKKERKHT